MKGYRFLGSMVQLIALTLGTTGLAESRNERAEPVTEQAGEALLFDTSLGKPAATPQAFDNPGNGVLYSQINRKFLLDVSSDDDSFSADMKTIVFDNCYAG